MHRSRSAEVTLITTAPNSRTADFERRRRRYAMMMAGRAVCVVVAALTYRISLWIALAMVVAGAVLPWCAVLIANDGPPRKRAMRPAPVAPLAEHALPGATEDRTVDG